MNNHRSQKIIVGVATVALASALWTTSPAHAQTSASKTKKQATTSTGFRTRRVNPARQRVTMSLQNASVRQALLQLLRKSGADFSLDSGVKGNITLKITDQPFNRALDLIVRNSSQPLRVEVDSGTYFIKPVPVATSTTASQRPVQTASVDENVPADAYANAPNNNVQSLGENNYYTPYAYGQVGNTIFTPGPYYGGGFSVGNTVFAPGYGGYGGYGGSFYSSPGFVPTNQGYLFTGPGFYNTNTQTGFLYGPGGGGITGPGSVYLGF